MDKCGLSCTQAAETFKYMREANDEAVVNAAENYALGGGSGIGFDVDGFLEEAGRQSEEGACNFDHMHSFMSNYGSERATRILSSVVPFPVEWEMERPGAWRSNLYQSTGWIFCR
jgi:hypothetical protein